MRAGSVIVVEQVLHFKPECLSVLGIFRVDLLPEFSKLVRIDDAGFALEHDAAENSHASL